MMSDQTSLDLYDFLREIDLHAYHEPIRIRLGISSFLQLSYVRKEDLTGIGIPLPLARLLIDKYKKKVGYKKIPFTNKRVKPPSIRASSDNTQLRGRSVEARSPDEDSFPRSIDGTTSRSTTAQLPRETGTPVLIAQSELTCLEQIGMGHFATVYKANWKGKEVAVKQLKEVSGSIDSLMKEVRVMFSLRHPAIVRFHGIVLDNQSSSQLVSIRLVFEYAAFGSLDRFLAEKRPRVSLQQLWGYCNQLLQGLVFLHDARLVHRDIAARNLLLFSSETLKLGDFGLSRCLPSAEECYTAESSVVPVAWSAPESLAHKRYSAASDVYMFGVTAWEIFSFAQHPWHRMTSSEVLAVLGAGNQLGQPEHCPDSVYVTLRQCLSFSPVQRPDTASLHALWAELTPTLVVATKPSTMPGRLQFNKNDQIYLITQPSSEPRSDPFCKGQNKRTFELGSLHVSCINSSPAHSNTTPVNAPSVPVPSTATPEPGPKGSPMSPTTAVKQTLIHVPAMKICPDGPSQWSDYYSDYSVPSTGRDNSRVNSRLPHRHQNSEHVDDLIDLSTMRPEPVPDPEFPSPPSHLCEPFVPLCKKEDEFSLYDDQEEFYSVIDSDEEYSDLSSSAQLSSPEERPAPPPVPNVPKSSYNAHPTVKTTRDVPENPNWQPINVQQPVAFFDDLPNVQYTSDECSTPTNEHETHTLSRDLIDLNTLSIKCSTDDQQGTLLAGGSRSPLTKSLETGGSRYSVDLQSVLAAENQSSGSQVDYCTELEQRIQKLKQMKPNSSIRMEKNVTTNTTNHTQNVSIFVNQNNLFTANPPSASFSNQPYPFTPLACGSNQHTSTLAYGNFFDSQFLGTSPTIDTPHVSNNRTRVDSPMAQVPHLPPPGVSAAQHSKSVPMPTQPVLQSRPQTQQHFQSPNTILWSNNQLGPTAPTYELISSNKMRALEANSESSVKRVCKSVVGSTEEQCYNALVETNWNEEQATRRVKLALLSSMCNYNQRNCMFILDGFTWDLAKAIKFIQDLPKGS